MLNKSILAIAFIFLSCTEKSTKPEENLTFDEKLYALSDLQFNEITPQNGYPRQFEIYISQLLDHDNPDGTKFNQQLFLSHIDDLAPVVFMPSGYSTNARTATELVHYLTQTKFM